MPLNRRQQIFVDISANNKNVKKCISSKEEYPFKKILSCFGQEGKDWFHQKPYYDEELGLVAIPDFVFPNYRLMIELDGVGHKYKAQRELDVKRDKVFNSNGFYLLRIKTPISPERLSYWKVYIEETIKICKEEIEKEKNRGERRKVLFTKKEFEKLFIKKLNQ